MSAARVIRSVAAALAMSFAWAAGARAEEPAEAARAIVEKVDLRDVPLADACRLLSDQTGLNLLPSAEAAPRRVSLYLRGVDALTAVEALCKAQQLWFHRDARTGIVRISTAQEYRRDLGTVEEEQIEYFTLLHPNALEVGRAIRNLFGRRVVLRLDTSGRDETDDLEDRLDRFDVIDERTQGLGVRVFSGTSGFGAGGFGASGTDRRSSRSADRADEAVPGGETQGPARSRARTDLTPEEIVELERALDGEGASEERRAAVLATFSGRDRAPIHVTLVRRQNKVVVRTADSRAMDQVRTLVSRLDVPTSLILLEVRILAVDLADGMSSFFEYQFGNDDVAGGFNLGSIRNPLPGSLDLEGTALRAGDLTFQYVNEHFAARLQVLRERDSVRVLSTPMLLTANNEVSRLFVGKEVPLNRSFTGGQAIANDNTVTTTPGSTAIEFRPVGTTLFITPNINADRTVTLRIVQESSDVNSTAPVLIPSETGFEQQTVNVVSSQTVSGTIVAKSDLAVAFGGLVETSTTKVDDAVPILGDLPLIGIAFSRKVDRETRREIVIVVRPYVIGTPSEAEAISRRVLSERGVDASVLGGAGAAEAPPAAPSGR